MAIEMKPCPVPCSGCALTEGAAANLEPHNAIKARLCVLGGTPFFCHDGMDWQNPLEHLPMTRAEFRAKYFKICAGWVREVRRLAQAGYFRERREWKRVWAQCAADALTMMFGEDDEEEKAILLSEFEAHFTRLINEEAKAYERHNNQNSLQSRERLHVVIMEQGMLDRR